jgi:hypothetical protein
MGHPRRGNAVVSVLTIIAITGFAALVIDLGYTRMVHYQLQAAADAAAHAGPAYLDGTSSGLTRAGNAAVSVGEANDANGTAVDLTYVSANTGSVQTGTWNYDNHTFTASTNAANVDAIYVITRATGLNAFFSAVAFDNDSMSTSASAIAVKPPTQLPGAVDCFLPLAVPLCSIQAHSASTLANYDFSFSTGGTDNSSWGDLYTHPTTTTVRNLLNNCEVEGEAEVGDRAYLNNGQIAAGLSAIATAIGNSTTRWNTSTLGTQPARMSGSAISATNYGKTIEGPVLVFDQGSQRCNSINYVQSYPLVGFAWGVVYDVKTTGNPKTTKLRINNRVEKTFGTQGGGTLDLGVVYQPPPMVVY